MQKVFYKSEGSGNALVLLHGFCEDHTIWDTIAPSLSQHYYLILADTPGFGKTALSMPAGGESLEMMADRLAHTLKEDGIEKCTLIGHSMGGYIALAFAERHEDMLDGLGLFHSTAMPDDEEKKANRLKQAEFVKSNGAIAHVNTLIPGLFSKSHDYTAQIQSSLEIGRRCQPEGIINALHAMRNRPDRVKVLKEAQVPVLIIAGMDDPVIPTEKLSYQASLPGRCEFELLNNSGHMGMVEEPVESVEIINRFMSFVKG